MSRRRALLAGITFLLVAALTAGDALAGDYVVAQCHPANAAHEALVDGADRGDYGMRDECSAAPDHSLKVVSTSGAPSGHEGYWYWQAPAGTRIVAVEVEAKLRRDEGHKARLFVADALGQPVGTVATGGDGATSFTTEQWTTPPGTGGAARFYAALVCDNNGDVCPLSSEAKTFVRHVEITLRDVSPPTVTLSGEGVEPGWRRGDQSLHITTADFGGGLVSRSIYVNGVGIRSSAECAPMGFGGFTFSLAPCTGALVRVEELRTATAPFHDGTNVVIVCAFDVATHGNPNQGCRARALQVDNTAPTLSFSNEQSPDDPELILGSAEDANAGVSEGSVRIEFRAVGDSLWTPIPTTIANGTMAARVNSEAYEPGRFEFRASAADAAGNRTSTQLRANGAPMQLMFPLKDRVNLSAFFPGGQAKQLAPYREAGRIEGYLRTPSGAPIAGQRLVVVENFNRGSLIRHRTSHVRSRSDGSFQTTIPGGPSRSVSVRYRGSKRYQSERAPRLDFNVRSRVSLRADPRVRAGSSARFHGAVGRYFARIPAGGKLVELQYKKRAKTWNTAKEAVGTASNGKISLGYRFRRYYVEPVTFTFRLKVTRESGWPYRVPAASKPVEVTVLPSRR